MVHVLSGATGSPFPTTLSSPGGALSESLFGYEMVGVGDLGGSEAGDLLVGAPNRYAEHDDSGILVLDGATGAVLCADIHHDQLDGYGSSLLADYHHPLMSSTVDLVVGSPDRASGAGGHSTRRITRLDGGCVIDDTSNAYASLPGSYDGNRLTRVWGASSSLYGPLFSGVYAVAAPGHDTISIYSGSGVLLSSVLPP